MRATRRTKRSSPPARTPSSNRIASFLAQRLVVTTAFNAKLTAKPVKGLNVVAGYKFDDRDNQTPVNTYFFQDANEARASAASAIQRCARPAAETLGSNINIYANRPYSKKLNQFDIDADYEVAKGHSAQGRIRVPADRPRSATDRGSTAPMRRGPARTRSGPNGERERRRERHGGSPTRSPSGASNTTRTRSSRSCPWRTSFRPAAQR